jgi:hypothetical protein
MMIARWGLNPDIFCLLSSTSYIYLHGPPPCRLETARRPSFGAKGHFGAISPLCELPSLASSL